MTSGFSKITDWLYADSASTYLLDTFITPNVDIDSISTKTYIYIPFTSTGNCEVKRIIGSTGSITLSGVTCVQTATLSKITITDLSTVFGSQWTANT